MERVEQKKTRKGGLVFAGIAIAIIIVLLAVILYLLLLRNTKPEEERRSVVVTPENVESVLLEMEERQQQESVAPAYYTVTMNPTWHFAAGDEASDDAVVINVETNTNDVYFDVVLADDEEQILYKSPVIPRGGRLEDIALDTPLEPGTYDCVVIYHLIDQEQQTLSTLRVAITILVEG